MSERRKQMYRLLNVSKTFNDKENIVNAVNKIGRAHV